MGDGKAEYPARPGKNTQPPLPDLLRDSIHSHLAGYQDLTNAERVSQELTFRLTGSEKIRDRGAAPPLRLHWFEIEVLPQSVFKWEIPLHANVHQSVAACSNICTLDSMDGSTPHISPRRID